MADISWSSIIILSFCVLGIMEWIKGFANKTGTLIHGNILRLIQLIFSIGFAFIIKYLPSFLIVGFVTLSVTTLCKTQVIDFIQNKISTFTDNNQKTTTK